MTKAYETIKTLLAQCTEEEQLSIMCALIQGGPEAGWRNDDFIDALMPVDKAFGDAWGELSRAAESYLPGAM